MNKQHWSFQWHTTGGLSTRLAHPCTLPALLFLCSVLCAGGQNPAHSCLCLCVGSVAVSTLPHCEFVSVPGFPCVSLSSRQAGRQARQSSPSGQNPRCVTPRLGIWESPPQTDRLCGPRLATPVYTPLPTGLGSNILNNIHFNGNIPILQYAYTVNL